MLSLAVFYGYLFLEKAYLFKDIGSDSINATYPTYLHLVDYLHAEGWPRWSFSQGMGQNIFPLETGDIFLPVMYLFGRNNLSFLLAYIEVAKILIGGVCFFLYLRQLGVTKYASFIGGVLFGFSGYMILGGGWYMFSYDAMCCAALLLGLECLFRRNIWWIIPLPIALLAAYQPFYLYLYGVLILVYSTVRFLEDQEWNLRAYAGLLGKLTAAGLLGAALSGVFLFENILQLLQSPRVASEASLFKSLMSQPLFAPGSASELSSVVLRLFSSDLQGTGNDFKGWQNYLESPLLYCGLIALLAAPQFIFSLQGRRRWLYTGLTAISVLALCFPYLRYTFWLFTGNYYRTFSFFISLLFLYLGVRGLSQVDRTAQVRPIVLVVSLAVLLGLLFVPHYELYTKVDQSLLAGIALLLIAYAGLIAMWGSPKFRRAAQVLTVGMVCLEAATFSFITVNHRNVITAEELGQRVGYNDYTLDAVKYLNATDKGFYRINKDFASGTAMHTSMNDAKAQNFYGSESYYSFNQLNYIKFLTGLDIVHPGKENETRWAVGVINRPLLQILSSVKYAFTKDPGRYGADVWIPVQTAGDVHILKNKFFVPLGVGYEKFVLQSEFSALDTFRKDRILTRAFVIDDSEQSQFAGLSHLDPFSLSPTLTISELEQDIGKLQESALQMEAHGQNLIRGTVDLRTSKLIFFSIPYDKGWSAMVDGKPVGIRLVDYGMSGLLLGPGRHTIELKFEPRFLVAGAAVSVVSAAVYILLLILTRRKRSAAAADFTENAVTS